MLHWIDVGQPDDKRLMRAAGRAERVTVISFSSSTPVWWKNIESKLTRAANLVVWQIEAAQSQALAKLAERGHAVAGDGARRHGVDEQRHRFGRNHTAPADRSPLKGAQR